MFSRERPGQTSFLPILEGKNNWIEWKQHLEVVLGAKDINLLDIITGVEKRPEDLVAAAAAIEALLKDEEPTMKALWEFSSPSSFSSPVSTDGTPSSSSSSSPPASGKDYQTKWEAKNKMALGYLTATVHEKLSHHIVKGKTAHEVYESLRAACEEKAVLSPCIKTIRWISYKYEPGQSAADFLHKWRFYLDEMRATYASAQQVPPLLCFHVFIGAVSNNAACVPWLNTLFLDRREFQEHDLNALYANFSVAESRRTGRNLGPQNGALPSASRHASPFYGERRPQEYSRVFTKKEDDSWCAIHKRKGHTTKDCWSNPRNSLNRRPNTMSTKNGHHQGSTSKGQPLKPAIPNNEKDFHSYLSDDEGSDNLPAPDCHRMRFPLRSTCVFIY